MYMCVCFDCCCCHAWLDCQLAIREPKFVGGGVVVVVVMQSSARFEKKLNQIKPALLCPNQTLLDK